MPAAPMTPTARCHFASLNVVGVVTDLVPEAAMASVTVPALVTAIAIVVVVVLLMDISGPPWVPLLLNQTSRLMLGRLLAVTALAMVPDVPFSVTAVVPSRGQGPATLRVTPPAYVPS